jgi:hypothetical protein
MKNLPQKACKGGRGQTACCHYWWNGQSTGLDSYRGTSAWVVHEAFGDVVHNLPEEFKAMGGSCRLRDYYKATDEDVASLRAA